MGRHVPATLSRLDHATTIGSVDPIEAVSLSERINDNYYSRLRQDLICKPLADGNAADNDLRLKVTSCELRAAKTNIDQRSAFTII
jgi:hypothetical protein